MKTNKIIGLLCLLALTLIYLIKYIKEKENDYELKQNGVSTVAKVYRFNNQKRYQNYYYYFYDKKNKFYGIEDINFPKLGEYSVNRFFRVKYLKDNPEICKIYIEQEVNDTTKILSKGFKIDITRKSYFESSTNEYKFKTVKYIY